jgi:hypothetical protein
MNTYHETAVLGGSQAMTVSDAKVLACMLDNDDVTNTEMGAIQNALRLFASKTNQVIHVTDGGAIYLATSHDLRESTDTIRLN